MFIGGKFTSFDGKIRNRVAQLRNDGGIDSAFDPGLGVDNTVNAISIYPNSTLLIGGVFNRVGSIHRDYLVRLFTEQDTSRISLFNPIIESLLFKVSIATVTGKKYIMESCENLAIGQWSATTIVDGDGSTKILMDVMGDKTMNYYRVRVE